MKVFLFILLLFVGPLFIPIGHVIQYDRTGLSGKTKTHYDLYIGTQNNYSRFLSDKDSFVFCLDPAGGLQCKKWNAIDLFMKRKLFGW